MKKFLIQAIFLIVIVGVAFFIFRTNPSISGLPFLPESAATRELQVGDARIKVEIADTQSKRSKGLGGRESIASDEGMLFVFPEIGKYPFWMKGLTFPLDFVWIRGDQVVDLTPNAKAPTPGQSDSDLPIYQSKEDMNKVLEVSAGTIQRSNIKIGDMIKFSP